MKEIKDLELENQAKRDKEEKIVVQNSVRQLVVSTITLLIVGIY